MKVKDLYLDPLIDYNCGHLWHRIKIYSSGKIGIDVVWSEGSPCVTMRYFKIDSIKPTLMSFCKNCKKPFQPNHNTMFCSNKCKKAFFKIHLREEHYHRNYYRRLKEELVSALGGKCEKCGYDKCMRALNIHHLDPTVKEGQTNMGRLTKKKVKEIIELWKQDKVKLLCANCHMEEHSD